MISVQLINFNQCQRNMLCTYAINIFTDHLEIFFDRSRTAEKKPRLVCIFLKLCFMVFCCLEGKTNGLLKLQPYLVSAFGVVTIENNKSRTISLWIAYRGKKCRRLLNQS